MKNEKYQKKKSKKSIWCSFRTGRSISLTQMDEGSPHPCSPLTSSVKYAERRNRNLCLSNNSHAFTCKNEVHRLVLKRLFLFLFLTSGFGVGCRRFYGLVVRCRLPPFPLLLFLVTVLESHFEPLEHEALDVHCLQSPFLLRYPSWTGTTGVALCMFT